jgi:hypothetical protein
MQFGAVVPGRPGGFPYPSPGSVFEPGSSDFETEGSALEKGKMREAEHHETPE